MTIELDPNDSIHNLILKVMNTAFQRGAKAKQEGKPFTDQVKNEYLKDVLFLIQEYAKDRPNQKKYERLIKEVNLTFKAGYDS